MRCESNSTWQNHGETQGSWRPLSILLHPNLQWHTSGHSRDRRQWGSMWNVLPPELFLHWLLLAAALPCQHVRHRHPLGQCFTQLIVTCRKNHIAIIQEGAPRFPSSSLSPSPSATRAFWHAVPFFLHCKMLESCSWKKTDAFGSSGYVPSLALEWFSPPCIKSKLKAPSWTPREEGMDHL